jgi:hypothetical protein
VQRLLATKGLAAASQQYTVSHFLFYPGIFFAKNMTVVPHPSYFYVFPQLKIKQKGHHFDTTEVTEAESQAVLNTFIEHDFQDTFQIMAEALGMVHTCGRKLLQG